MLSGKLFTIKILNVIDLFFVVLPEDYLQDSHVTCGTWAPHLKGIVNKIFPESGFSSHPLLGGYELNSS